MSCFVIGRNNYINLAQTLLWIEQERNYGNDEKNKETIKEWVSSLYHLNQKAYFYRYREEEDFDELNLDDKVAKRKYVETPIMTLKRIICFLRCVAYQCNESDELHSESMKIIKDITYYSAVALIGSYDDDNIKYGEF